MRPGCAAFLGLPLTGSGFSGMSHAVRACPRQRPHIVQRPTLATQALLLSWVAEGPYPGLLGAAPPCEQAICLASSRRAQNDLLAVVLQCPSYLGISGPRGKRIHSSLLSAAQSPLAFGQTRELGQYVGGRAPQLPCFLPPWGREAQRLAQGGGNLPGGAKPGEPALSQCQQALGLRHWLPRPTFPWGLGEKLGPFPLSPSPGEARQPGQATFSRSLERVPGNKSCEAFCTGQDISCGASKPGLRGAEHTEGDHLHWGRHDRLLPCSEQLSHACRPFSDLSPWKALVIL